MVHGDDFIFVGEDESLNKVQAMMQKSFLIKVIGRLGGDTTDDKEIRILNRVIRWGNTGIEYEADPRHAELLARDLGVGNKVSTPGVKEEKQKEGDEPTPADEPLELGDVRVFRSGAARANYLSLDRPELAFATKELCRRMTSPRHRDMAALQRVARYLAAEPRVVYHYPWQASGSLMVFVDTDFAGCLITRKSTSGGCAMVGWHLVKHWSSTQKVVTLSSGEAELAGIVKGSAEGLGLKSLAEDLGMTIELKVFADASAAIGICRRSGIGKVRHLATGQLWVQEKIRDKEFQLFKIPGAENPADILTKHVPRDLVDKLIKYIGVYRQKGRAENAPSLVG